MSPMILDHGKGFTVRRLPKVNDRYEVTPASVEDIRRLVDIEFHAFENERSNQILSFRDYRKPAHFERAVGIYTAAMAPAYPFNGESKAKGYRCDGRQEPQNPWHRLTFLKVCDVETEAIVSFAKAETMSYSIHELRGPADAGHEREAKMNREWFAYNEQLRRDYMGLAEHCYIGMLATRPCYQHNGAGTMLLDALLTEADDAGVECYLEATDTAKPLYEKHGFVTVNEIYFNPAQYGLRGFDVEHQTVMVRGALGPDGSRAQVRSWDVAVAQAQAQAEGSQ